MNVATAIYSRANIASSEPYRPSSTRNSSKPNAARLYFRNDGRKERKKNHCHTYTHTIPHRMAFSVAGSAVICATKQNDTKKTRTKRFGASARNLLFFFWRFRSSSPHSVGFGFVFGMSFGLVCAPSLPVKCSNFISMCNWCGYCWRCGGGGGGGAKSAIVTSANAGERNKRRQTRLMCNGKQRKENLWDVRTHHHPNKYKITDTRSELYLYSAFGGLCCFWHFERCNHTKSVWCSCTPCASIPHISVSRSVLGSQRRALQTTRRQPLFCMQMSFRWSNINIFEPKIPVLTTS